MKQLRKVYIVPAILLMLWIVNISATRYIVSHDPPTPAERMYDAILCYADSFDIPLEFAFNIATLETGYRGPADSTYNPSQVSYCGAMGPMQIMHKYAEYFAGFPVTKKVLRDSIEFNVWLSMKILHRHYKKYGDWKTVAGVYNTGQPIHNKYAVKAADFSYFSRKWIKQPITIIEDENLYRDSTEVAE